MAAAGKKLTQTVVNNTIAASASNSVSNMQSITQLLTTRFVLGGTVVAAGAAYHIGNVRKEAEINARLDIQAKESECLRREMESQRREMRTQMESLRREMESMCREYDAKLEGKSSRWSWFW